MNKIKYAHVVRNDGYRRIIALYEDGSWENLFNLHSHKELFDGKKIIGKTKNEAIEIIHNIILKD